MGPKAPVCSTPLNATVCEPSQRTVNTDAPCGGPTDYFYYSPWRRPGSAPVIDSCGSAGGRIAGQGAGDFGARYQNTTHAKIGDLGSNLPYIPSSVEWVAGNDYEVSWTLQANHGGGYSYRLCPLGSTLDEECFKKLPLNFTGMSKLRWGGKGGHSVMFNATYVTQGTSPEGSMWAKNPIPRAWRDVHGNWGKGSNQFQTGEGFQPVCIDNGEDPIGNQYSCTGMWGPYNLEIVDRVVIPDNIPTGKYVLGFRWDCEESNQIWQSCSDINVINNKPLPPTTTPQGFTCGTPGNNAGMQLKNSPIAAPNPCYCATLCYDNPDCKAWTYSSSTFKRQGKGCYLRSEYGPVVDNCDVKGDCFSGQTRT